MFFPPAEPVGVVEAAAEVEVEVELEVELELEEEEVEVVAGRTKLVSMSI